ncbi:alpha/beta hydrolase [Pseudodesulfovibrio sediminis]|uniref:AB hydrolase-1 domain-containing protein n=1 Tax=Pseudodesulfovibrio sediminis TaxID=2810563 RepID=A0ABN6ESY5_9BACT|nr:alpha/beta fold hydrolase [Pseudodesulfovibrio sediminis]BCS88274.1 hypothetical protein PSDVSF_15160 [Pseudodesulfovibrio sediminis]
MSDINLIWCHGSLGEPWGTKSKALAETSAQLGLTMEAPDFRETEDPDLRVQWLLDLLEEKTGPTILAGSSMGGYVATAAAKHANVLGLFLLAPAFYFPGYDIHVFTKLPPVITVVHGWDDDVVPVEHAIRFAKGHKADLHIFDDNHRLQNSTGTLCTLFSSFLTSITA